MTEAVFFTLRCIRPVYSPQFIGFLHHPFKGFSRAFKPFSRALHLISVSDWHSFIIFEPLWNLLFRDSCLKTGFCSSWNSWNSRNSASVLQGRLHSGNIMLLRAHRVTQAVTAPETPGKTGSPSFMPVNTGSGDFWVFQKHWRCHHRSVRSISCCHNSHISISVICVLSAISPGMFGAVQ